MNPVIILRKEHEAIEMELSELDFIMSEGDINYSNLVHTFWKTCELWDGHEKLEEDIFDVMKKEGFEIPIDAILLEHKSLSGRVESITNAINSGSDFEVRKVLAKEMREFVDVLRVHMDREDDVFSGVLVSEFSEEGLREIKRIVGKYQ
ncbi:hypothetical protein GOV13_04335 [Candidatus Pacearchaeota archaeon]|nr:hypothetical protein [Candidatus Pacearchaeota archaeon]